MHDEILRQGLNPERLTYNTLISACVKMENMDAAMQFFEEMKVSCVYLEGRFSAVYTCLDGILY